MVIVGEIRGIQIIQFRFNRYVGRQGEEYGKQRSMTDGRNLMWMMAFCFEVITLGVRRLTGR